MTSTEPDPGSQPRRDERLLRCSTERTLLVRWRPDGEAEELIKVFERGSLIDAQREADLGRELGLSGVVRYRSAGRDPATGRPCLVMDFHHGRDLEVIVSERGPLPPRTAARIGLQIAETLTGLHRSSIPSAPHGLAHGDVKPGNVLFIERGEPEVLLLDLEHSVPLEPEGSPSNGVEAGRFSGGTHGFAPPEAYLGTHPDPAAESFAFGATLHFMLTGVPPFRGTDPHSVAAAAQAGRRRDWLLRGLPLKLGNLVRTALGPEPERRPSFREIARTLSAFLASQTEDDRVMDAALGHLQAAELEDASAQLATLERADPRLAELREVLRRRCYLIQRHREPPQRLHTDDLLELARGLIASIPRLSAWLMRFPRQPTALETREHYRARAAELLLAVPPEVARLKREVRFDEAEELLEAAAQAMRLALSQPGPLTVGEDIPARLPGPMQRDPLRFLRLALEDVKSAAAAHAKLLHKLEDAEAQLHMDEAAQVVDAIASVQGGASFVVAELKDRLHRLGFYLEEIGLPRHDLQRLEEQLARANAEQDLGPLRDFLQLCASRAPHGEASPPRAKFGLRSLQRGMHDLVREFPHVAPLAQPAVDVLDRSLGIISDLAWEMIESARSKLEAVPIPVRPLQLILNRLDNLNLLQVLVDRPERSRAELLDELESIRLHVQKARDTRDRIARGAEQAMARGHWTTALYDMQRAVDHLELAEPNSTDRNLIEKFEQVKRTKQEIEGAIRSNLDLARTYSTLLDKPESSSEERLQVLKKRRESLQILVEMLKDEKATPYLHDLHEVDVNIVQERSVRAEHFLDESSEPEERLRIAASTLQMLDESYHGEPVGRVQRLITHWEHQHNRIREEVDRRDRESRAAQARRRRILWLCLTALVIIAAVVVAVSL